MPHVCRVNQVIINGTLGDVHWLLLFVVLQFCALLVLSYYTRRRMRDFQSALAQRDELIEKLTAERVKEESPPSQSDAGEGDRVWLGQVEECVKANIEDLNFGVDRLAELMGMGRTSFYQRIRSDTGMSPNEYIREMRLQAARELLESGQVTSSKALCEQVGMRSASYFSRLYKERFGELPGVYS